MNATRALHDLGQRLWLDDIRRDMLEDGTLRRYIDGFSVTGLTSNPTIYHRAVAESDAYDWEIQRLRRRGLSGERLFFEMAAQDLANAADFFTSLHSRTDGEDGWVSLEVSPLLAYDAARTVIQAVHLHRRIGRDNLFIKIPGTSEGLSAVEEAVFRGVPVNVTLLFSREQYLAAAEAHARGLERRLEAGLHPVVSSVASLFISRWDRAVAGREPDGLHERLGIAMGRRAYAAYLDFLASERWRKLERLGATPQRLLFASTGTKNPESSDVMYVEALSVPRTINTMPEATLRAFADHGKVRGAREGDDAEAGEVAAKFVESGVDLADLADRLQVEGVRAFVSSWKDLLRAIETKGKTMKLMPPSWGHPDGNDPDMPYSNDRRHGAA